MKKRHIGYIFFSKTIGVEERLFKKIAKENGFVVIMFNLYKMLDEKELEKKVKKCRIIYNNSAEDFAIEFVKTLEGLGKKVIESSKSYFFSEDKWYFYLRCKENNIRVPETILLSEDLNLIPPELTKFNRWPVVIKRVNGTVGEYVDRAENMKEALEIINKFWKKGGKSPIIAQEFIKSHCFRVTVVDDKIVQAVVKNSNGWKETGSYSKESSIKKIKIDKKLRQIVKKIMKLCRIKVCGIDLLRYKDDWLMLEVNSQPAFDFISSEKEHIIRKIIKMLKREAIKNTTVRLR